MKKVFVSVLILLCLFTAVQAASGDIAGNIYSTDIRAYINGVEVPSYNIGGKTAVVIEDIFNPEIQASYSYSDYYRTLKIWSFAPSRLAEGSSQVSDKPGTPIGNIYETDIKTSIYDVVLPSYNIGGKTAVVIEDLGSDKEFSELGGKYVWDEESRTISLEFMYSSPNDTAKHTDIIITANEDLTEGYAEFKEIYQCDPTAEHFNWPEWVNDNAEITTIFPIMSDGETIGYYFRRPSVDYKFTAFTYYYEDKLTAASENYIPLNVTREDVINHYKQRHIGVEQERFDTDDYSFVYMTAGLPSGVGYMLLRINADGTYHNYMPDIYNYRFRINNLNIDKENEKVYFSYGKDELTDYVIDLKTGEFNEM